MKITKIQVKYIYLYSDISKLNTFLFLKPDLKSIIINIDNLIQHISQMEKNIFKRDSPNNAVNRFKCLGQ